MKSVVIAVVVLALVGACGLGAWLGIQGNQDFALRALERYEYEGCVTALKYNDDGNETVVWLNSDPKAVEIKGDVTLAVGGVYLITVDGNDNLINAELIGD